MTDNTRLAAQSLSRRAVVVGGMTSAAALAVGGNEAVGQVLRGRQTEGSLRPRPIAIPPFVGDDPRLAAAIANIVQADLERSGLFRPLDRTAFIEQIDSLKRAPRFADWRAVGAEALVVGNTTRL